MKRVFIPIFIVVLIGGFFTASIARAAVESSLQITPFIFEKDMHRGQQGTETISITNASKSQKILHVSLNDFLPSGTDGQTEILPVDTFASSQTSLSRWIIINQQPTYVLAAGESTRMVFTIAIPVDAEPGAHYSALVITLGDQLGQPAETEVRQQAAALIIVDVDRSFERGVISSFHISELGNQTSQLQFATTFHNNGLSSLKPKGKITLYNIFHKPVAVVPINRDASTVLPGTDRIFISSLSGHFWGLYSATAEVTFGSNKLQSISHVYFWVWPSATALIWDTILVVVVAIILVIAIKRYNAWIRLRAKKYPSA